MATLDSSDFSTADGWTEIDSGTKVSFGNTEGGRTFMRIANGGYNTDGARRTTPQAGAAGHTIYYRFRTSTFGINGFMHGFDHAATFNGNNGVFCYNEITNKNILREDGSNTQSNAMAFANDTWYSMKWVIQSDGTADVFRSTDADSALDAIETWTELFSSTVANAFSFTASDLYFIINGVGESGNIDFSEWYYTDDGEISTDESTPASPARKLICQGQM